MSRWAGARRLLQRAKKGNDVDEAMSGFVGDGRGEAHGWRGRNVVSEPFRAPSWTYIKEQVAEFEDQTAYGRRAFITHFDKDYKEKRLRDWARMVEAVTDAGADIDGADCHVHSFPPTQGGAND